MKKFPKMPLKKRLNMILSFLEAGQTSKALSLMEALPLASKLLEKCKKNELTLAVAESCTGGLLSSMLTDISGSSKVFLGGLVAYSNKLKEHCLAVPGETLKQNGAVSFETALAMARGVRRVTNANVVMATTGIAGPSGGNKRKPVGTVFIAVITDNLEAVYPLHFKGDRKKLKYLFASSALALALSALH